VGKLIAAYCSVLYTKIITIVVLVYRRGCGYYCRWGEVHHARLGGGRRRGAESNRAQYSQSRLISRSAVPADGVVKHGSARANVESLVHRDCEGIVA